MDGQNFNNEQNNMYQDNTASIPVAPVMQAIPEKKTDVLGIISLVAGILAILCSCCLGLAAAIPAIIGIVCAILSKKNSGKNGIATAGLICSIVAIVLGILVSLIVGAGLLAIIGMSEAAYY